MQDVKLSAVRDLLMPGLCAWEGVSPPLLFDMLVDTGGEGIIVKGTNPVTGLTLGFVMPIEYIAAGKHKEAAPPDKTFAEHMQILVDELRGRDYED